MAESTTPARTPLTRERIFAQALEIIDQEGLAALSMRHLGAALGVEAMAIYHHVPNKDALLAGVVELLLAPGGAVPKGMGWREGLRWSADTLHATMQAHPAAVPLVMSSPLRADPVTRLVEDQLALLTGAGFAPRDAVGLLQSALALLFGWITLESASQQAGVADRTTTAADAGTASSLAPLMNDWSAGFGATLDALLDAWSHRLPPGSKGAPRPVASAANVSGGSAWIVEKGGEEHKSHKKGKAKKKDKGAKKG